MGGSSVGKDLVQSIISKTYSIPICVSSTSRPMRVNEINHESYHFLSENEFLDDFHNGKFVEHRTYDTVSGIWYYGLSKDSVDINTNQLVVVDQQGYYKLIEVFGQENILGIYLYAPERIKIIRAFDRELRTDKAFFAEIYRRMADDLNAFNLCEGDANVIKLENIVIEDVIGNISSILKTKGVVEC